MKVKCIKLDSLNILELNKEYKASSESDMAYTIYLDNGACLGQFYKDYFTTLQEDTVKKEENKVEHPTHYNKGIECWDYIISHNMDFLTGNIIKYITRYKYKNGLEDLYKAREYLNKLIEEKNKTNTL